MKRYQNVLKYLGLVLFGFGVTNHLVLADPVWHCSRSEVQVADASDDFTLAALTLEREVIRISLKDLYVVYQGAPVKMSGGLPLSACVISNNSNLTATAMQSIGVRSATLKVLARESTQSKSQVHLVQDEMAMLACITKHHPAIGYLSKATHTEAVGPCF